MSQGRDAGKVRVFQYELTLETQATEGYGEPLCRFDMHSIGRMHGGGMYVLDLQASRQLPQVAVASYEDT